MKSSVASGAGPEALTAIVEDAPPSASRVSFPQAGKRRRDGNELYDFIRALKLRRNFVGDPPPCAHSAQEIRSMRLLFPDLINIERGHILQGRMCQGYVCEPARLDAINRYVVGHAAGEKFK